MGYAPYYFTHRWATWSQNDIINVLDISFGMMAIPNMVATLILAPRVIEVTRKYFDKYL